MTTDLSDLSDASDVAPRSRAEADIAAHTSPARARLELLVIGMGALAVSMSQGLLIPVLSTLPRRLHTSAGTVEWLLTSTLLVGAVAVPLLGRLGDMFGKRRMMLVSLGALVLGSTITALTSSIPLLIVGRAIQGASLATIPLGISLLSSLLPKERVGAAIAVISAMLGVGGALALPLAGVLGQRYDFHILFWVTAVAGAIGLIGVLLIVPESPSRSGGRIDLVGGALLSASLVLLLLPLAEASTWGWGSPKTLGLLALGVATVALFGWTQTRINQPLVDLTALRARPIVLTNLASVLFGFALFASLIGTAGYLQAPTETGYGFGSSIVASGLYMLPTGLMMLLFAPVAARLIASRGAAQTLALGALIVALGWLMRIVVTGALWEVIAGGVVVGIGTGIGYAAMPTLINTHTPADRLAAANGLNTLARGIGTSLASAIGGSLLASQLVTLSDGSSASTLGSYQELFGASALAGVVAAIAALCIPGAFAVRRQLSPAPVRT